MLTEEQKANRLTGVYGTDAAVICGKSPYKTPYELWEEKTGLRVAEDISHKAVIKAGNYLEPAIRQWFSDETGFNVHVCAPEYQHHSYAWMRGHVDGVIAHRSELEVPEMGRKFILDTAFALLEIKTASPYMAKLWGEAGENVIPTEYLLQVAHYCAVTDLTKAYIAVLIGGSDFRIYTYDRNLELERKLIEREKHFWEVNVLQNIPPDFSNAEDVMKGCIADPESILIADNKLEETVNALSNCRRSMKQLEEIEKEHKDIICIKMREKEILVDGFGKQLITWKTAKASQRFDLEKFKKDLPDLYNDYLRKDTHETRRFLLK